MRMGGCNRDGVCNRGWKGWREAPCWFLVQVTEWQVELCVFECNKTRAGRALGTRRGGLLPVLLVSWQVRSPFCQRPHPQLNYCQTPRFLLFLLRVQFGQQSPPLCSGSWADVLKHVDGSLRIPICCPWRCARGAGNWLSLLQEVQGIVFLHRVSKDFRTLIQQDDEKQKIKMLGISDVSVMNVLRH